MDLSTLRLQLMLAMGLPATMSCGAVERSHEDPPDDPKAGDSVVSAVSTPSVKSAGSGCRPDELPETVCGGAVTDSGASACYGNGTHLTSYGQSQLHVTQGAQSAHDPAYADFTFDPAATQGYRDLLAKEHLPLEQYCCFARCTPLVVATAAPLDPQPGMHVVARCLPAPPGGTRAPSSQSAACPGAVELAGALRPLDHTAEGACCYAVLTPNPSPEEHRHPRGRLARIDGIPHLPSVAASRARSVGAWSSSGPVPDVHQLPPGRRAALSAAWTTAARLEYASIASFSGLAIQLVAVGAPPHLVAAAQRAGLDEIEHARVAFAFASAYAGFPVGPAPFPAAAHLGSGDLQTLALDSFVDGCIAETVAAVEASRAAARAIDPVVARALSVIAHDEARHAELAWRIVAWCRRADPTLGPLLDHALTEAIAGSSLDDAEPAVDLSSDGVLPAVALRALRADVLHQIVAPCAQALAAG